MNSELACHIPSDWIVTFSACLYDWQTLISGLLALLAALLASCLIQKQIRQTEKIHRVEVSRRHAAVRCVLPLALSGISRFLQNLADSIAEEIERLDQALQADPDDPIVFMSMPRARFDPLEVPADQIAIIRDFVETLMRPGEIKHIAELSAQLQVLQARYNDFDFTQVCLADSLHALLLDVAVVGALNDSIFNYARTVDEGEFGIVGRLANDAAWLLVQRKLHGLVFSRPRFDIFVAEAHARIKRFKENDTSPWLEKFEI